MPSKGVLAQRNEELRREVAEKRADFENDKINTLEFEAFIEKAEKENADIAVAQKAYQRSLGFAGSAGPEPDGDAPPETQEQPPVFKEYRDGFARIKAAAATPTRHRAEIAFDFGLKSYDEEMRMKAQGIANLQGESATGTTTPAALAGGAYFLAGTAGPFITPEFQPGVVELRFYENVIEQLIPSYAVDSPVFSYVRESTWTNASAAVWEGQTKPTSTHTFTRFTEQVGKVANLEWVTDELIQDAPYIWSLIQQRLVQGVQRKSEVELLAGIGMPGVNGLLNRTAGFTLPQTITAVTNLVVPAAATPGIGAGTDTVASVTPGRAVVGTGTTGTAPTGVAIAEGILDAVVDIRTRTFFEPDAVVMNPFDFVTIRKAKDNNLQYYGGSMWGSNYGYPQNAPTPNAVTRFGLWDKQVVTTPAMPQGFLLVGDFRDYNYVLRRGGLRVDVTNTNGNAFEQNLWTARGEQRIGLVVERPELFELIQLKNAP